MKKKYDFSNAKKVKPVKEVKVLKSIRLDPEVLNWLQESAEKEGMGYQTYLNWFLRKSMQQEMDIEDRLQNLEKKVFKKKTA